MNGTTENTSMTGINDKARNGTSCVSLTPISVANSYNRGGGYNEGSMIGEHFLRHFSFFKKSRL